MRPSTLAAIPLLGALAVGLLSAVAGGPRLWLAAQNVSLVLGAVGCFAAAAALRRGDFLFRAWALYGLSHALPLLRRIVFGSGFPSRGGGALSVALDAVYILAANGARVAGSVLFVIAFSRAGLGRAAPAGAGRGAQLAAVVVGLGLGLPTLAVYMQSTLAAGAPARTFWGAVAIAADTACFLMVVPLARIAGAFRGGALQAPWAFLAAANLGWLVYDAWRTAAMVAGWGAAGRGASEAVLAWACLCALAAGLAHRSAVSAAERTQTPSPRAS